MLELEVASAGVVVNGSHGFAGGAIGDVGVAVFAGGVAVRGIGEAVFAGGVAVCGPGVAASTFKIMLRAPADRAAAPNSNSKHSTAIICIFTRASSL